MLESTENLENIFENAVREAEKRKHEYVTVEHVLLALIKDESSKIILIQNAMISNPKVRSQ
jgi:ATP-dependent Clp protease ATP-binding subunit ClpA